MRRLLVIEDGDEYAEFARVFLTRHFSIDVAKRGEDALACLRSRPAHGLLIDLRFDRAASTDLVGDIAATAARLFAGDQERALRHLQDQQGVLILAELRAAGFMQPAVFIHDFPQRRMENLKKLYDPVHAVPSFDAALLLQILGGAD
jgi:hypothetical protein